MIEMGDSSTGKIVWYVAVHQPTTAREIADGLGTTRSNATSQLLKLWRNNLLVRRKHPDGDGGAKTAYQYAIRVPEDSNE